MGITLNDYVINLNGNPAANADGSDIRVDTTRHGLIVAAGFAEDARLAGVSVTDEKSQTLLQRNFFVSPFIPRISLRDVVAPLISSTNTAVPYNLGASSGQQSQSIINTNSFYFTGYNDVILIKNTHVVSLILPSILARVAIFLPQASGHAILRSFSVNEKNENTMTKFKVKSFDASYAVGTAETLKKLTYRISSTAPIISFSGGHSIATLGVTKDDLVIWAASDTSVDAETVEISLANAGVSYQNLLNETFAHAITNPLDNKQYKVGSAVRVDRVKADGTIRADFLDVTGSVQAIRLTPSVEILFSPAAYTPPAENLAYFQFHVPVSQRLLPKYQPWMLALLDALQHTGELGQIGNWPAEVLQSDALGVPTEWNETMIWAIHKDFLNANYLPFGAVEILGSRDLMEARREQLTKQL